MVQHVFIRYGILSYYTIKASRVKYSCKLM